MSNSQRSSPDPPQRAYWAKLEQDPRSLQETLFREIAYTYGRQYENVFLVPALLKARQAFYLALRGWYGVDRWPLKQILNWRVRRTIKSYDLRRGLPTSDPDLRTAAARSESVREL